MCAELYCDIVSVMIRKQRSRSIFIVDSYNFFAMNRGKTSCDGIGTAVQRKVRCAILQRPADKPVFGKKVYFIQREQCPTIEHITNSSYLMRKVTNLTF